MSTPSRKAWSATAAVALLTLAGCGSSARSQASNSVPNGPTSESAATTSNGTVTTPGAQPSAGSGSATATSVPVVAPPNPVTTSAPGTSGKCLSGTVSVVYPAASNPLRSVCVHLGTAVNVELMAIRGTTWTAATPSDPSIATVTDQVGNGGTRYDSVRLLKPGTVTLSSVSTYGPDPHGPASQKWTLTVTVVP